MPLSPGTTLGVYEVTATIGEGGMGEVYRASLILVQNWTSELTERIPNP